MREIELYEKLRSEKQSINDIFEKYFFRKL